MRIASLALDYLQDVFRARIKANGGDNYDRCFVPILEVPDTPESQTPTCLGSQHHPQEDEY